MNIKSTVNHSDYRKLIKDRCEFFAKAEQLRDSTDVISCTASPPSNERSQRHT